MRRGFSLTGLRLTVLIAPIFVAACGGGARPAQSQAAATPAPAAAAPSPAPQQTQTGAAPPPRESPAEAAARRAEAVRREILEDVPSGPSAGGPAGPAPGTVLSFVVYFDFDRADLRPQDREAVEAVLDLLLRDRSARVRIEGHADERGSDEYNLALGLRRAATIQRYLTAAGVESRRLEITSFGEERPAVAGSGEAAWSRNRRVEFRVLEP